MSTLSTASSTRLPAPLGALPIKLEPETSAEDAATIARYERLTTHERMRACHLLAVSRADLSLCIAAIEATRKDCHL